MSQKITKLIISFVVTTLFGLAAKQNINGLALDFLWIPYLSFATALSIQFFDLLVDYIDFDRINKLKEENQVIYTVALSILSAGFAIAIAIFLK